MKVPDEISGNNEAEETVETKQKFVEAGIAQQNIIENQQNARPLMQRQRKVEMDAKTDDDIEMESVETKAENIPQPKNAVLFDTDRELETTTRLLKDVHRIFFERKDTLIKSNSTRQIEVSSILTEMKSFVFRNVHIVFSGVIPLGADPKL